jgi:AraC-like DNA-binding protein
VEIRSIVPGGPFAGLSTHFSDDTKVLFVVEGPKAVAVRRNVSVRTLCRQFRTGGRSLAHVRRECRAELVAKLLLAGLPVGVIAVSLGLSGSQALGRFVRAFFDRTPTQLRDELRRLSICRT